MFFVASGNAFPYRARLQEFEWFRTRTILQLVRLSCIPVCCATVHFFVCLFVVHQNTSRETYAPTSDKVSFVILLRETLSNGRCFMQYQIDCSAVLVDRVGPNCMDTVAQAAVLVQYTGKTCIGTRLFSAPSSLSLPGGLQTRKHEKRGA